MTLPRAEVVPGLNAELADFEELVRSLSPAEMAAPTRCEGWTAADVAAHVIGGLADVVAGRFDGLGTPEVTDREVQERRGRSSEELADELHGVAKVGSDITAAIDDAAWEGPGPANVSPTLGAGVEALWYDAYLHAQDIRTAIGRPPTSGPGLRASVSHLADTLTQRGWGPATLALDGCEEFAVSGGGRTITGEPLAFVLAATGRADPSALGLDAAVNIYA
jgi:uncharacterized protein (TIGR03083 family)